MDFTWILLGLLLRFFLELRRRFQHPVNYNITRFSSLKEVRCHFHTYNVYDEDIFLEKPYFFRELGDFM